MDLQVFRNIISEHSQKYFYWWLLFPWDQGLVGELAAPDNFIIYWDVTKNKHLSSFNFDSVI